MSALELRETGGGVSLRVRVQPRGCGDAIAGERGGALLVRVTAAPVAGAANEALIRLLAHALGVAVSSVRLLRGAAARDKLLHIDGVGREQVLRLLAPGVRRV